MQHRHFWTGALLLSAAASLLAAVPACSKSSSSNKMSVVGFSPRNKATNVDPGTLIWVKFSTGVDLGSVDKQSFQVKGSLSGEALGAYALEDNDRKVVFTPAQPFDDGETVTVRINSDVKGLSGVSARKKTFSFTIKPGVAPPPAPTIVSRSPAPHATGAPRDADITLVFDRSMDPFSFTQDSVAVSGQYSGRLTVQIGALQNAGKELRLAPERLFLPGERITVSLSSQIASAEGGRFAGDTFSFQAASDAPAAARVRGAEVPIGGKALELIAADFDQDGAVDLAVRLENGESVLTFRGDGQGGFAAGPSLDVGQLVLSVLAADLDGDGLMDLIAGSLDRVVVFGNASDDAGLAFDVPAPVAIGSQVHALSAGDLDHSAVRRPDFVLDTTSGFEVFLGGLAGSAAHKLGDRRLGRTSVLLRDLDNDGLLEVIVGDAEGNKISIRSFAPGVGLGARSEKGLPNDAHQILVDDLDRDGRPELISLVPSAQGGELILISPSPVGGGGGDGQMLAVASLSPSHLSLADLDGDGWLDLLVGNPESASLHYVRNREGSFDLAGEAEKLIEQEPLQHVAAFDANGDGVLDLVASAGDRLITLLSGAPLSNHLRVGGASAEPGQSAAAAVTISNDSSLQGFTVVLGFDAAALEATDISIADTAVGALAPEFAVPVIENGLGFLSFNAIFDFMPPFEDRILLPGSDQVLFRPTFKVKSNASPGNYALTFPESAGAAPPQRTVLTSAGRTVPHTAEGGAFTVLEPSLPPNLLSYSPVSAEVGALGVPVELLISNQDVLDAVSVVCGYDPGPLDAVIVNFDGTVTESLSADFANHALDAAAGVAAVEIVFDNQPPLLEKRLPAGDSQILAKLVFNVRESAATGPQTLTFPAGGLGLRTQLLRDGIERPFGTRNGTFTITPELTPDNILGFGPVEAKQADKAVPVHVLIANDTPIDAFSVFVAFDPAALLPVSISLTGTATEAIGAEFTNVRMPFGEPYVGLDAIFDFRAPFESKQLPPGSAQILFKPIFDVLQTASVGDHPLTILQSTGSDETRLLHEGQRIAYTSVDGVFKVNQGPPPPENPNKFRLREITVPPGVEDFPTSVMLSTIHEIDAITVTGVYDKAHVQVTDFNTVGTVIEPLAPELVVTKIEDTTDPPFFAYSAIFDVFPPFENKKILPGNEKTLLHVIFDVPDGTPEGEYTLELKNELGNPPLSNSIVVTTPEKGARTVFPAISGGKVIVKQIENPSFLRGDTNGSGKLDLADHVYLINYVFRKGPKPPCMDAADVDDNGLIEFLDMVLILDYLFEATFVPPPPFPDYGKDTTPDALNCDVGIDDA
jgi:hypothetical protein